MKFLPQSEVKPLGLAILSGLLLGFAFPPTGLAGGFLAFFGLVPLLTALESSTTFRVSFRRAFVAMFVFGLVATWWVGGWNGRGDVDSFLMLGGVMLMIVHPFFLMIPIVLYNLVRRRFGRRVALTSLPFFYAGFEFWHSFGDLSFPWLDLHNTQTYNLYFIQFIELIGPYALTAIIVAINSKIFQLLEWRKYPAKSRIWLALSLVAMVTLPYIYGVIAMKQIAPSKTAINLTVLQPNINPWAKWQTNETAILDTNFSSTSAALQTSSINSKPDVIIWPETAITFFITDPGHYRELQRFERFVTQIHTPILTGFPDIEYYEPSKAKLPEDAKPAGSTSVYYRSWNAAMLAYQSVTGAFILDRYHKQKLVPLGEHVPFIDQFPFLGKIFQWSVGLGSWNRGEGHKLLSMPFGSDSIRFGPMICYESIYPSFVRHFANEGANVLTVITNDGWYGDSPGPYQHNRYAVLRAIENRRWVARSANTGISSFIDDRGRMVQTLPVFASGSLTARVPLITVKTFYTRYGDFFAIPCALFSGGLFLYFLIITMLRRPIFRRSKRSELA